MRLSALEQVPLFDGSTPHQALEDMVSLARGLEEMGFHRFWIAEHHNTPVFMSMDTVTLFGIGLVAAFAVLTLVSHWFGWRDGYASGQLTDGRKVLHPSNLVPRTR